MVNGIICGLGSNGYILAINAMHEFAKMKIDKKLIKELTEYLNEFNLTEIEYSEKDYKIKVSKAANKISSSENISSRGFKS